MSNMHLVTGYAGTPHVTAADQGSMYAAIFGSGAFVLERGSQFAASIVSNNSIIVADGDLLLQGRHARIEEGVTVDISIENGAAGYYRNDLIVARYTRNADTGIENIALTVLKGTPVTADPSDPECSSGDIITDHALQTDFPLYRVQLDGINIQALTPLFSVMAVIQSQAKAANELAGNAKAAAANAQTTADNATDAAKNAQSTANEALALSSKNSAHIGDSWNDISDEFVVSVSSGDCKVNAFNVYKRGSRYHVYLSVRLTASIAAGDTVGRLTFSGALPPYDLQAVCSSGACIGVANFNHGGTITIKNHAAAASDSYTYTFNFEYEV